jgi:hypothetical protein
MKISFQTSTKAGAVHDDIFPLQIGSDVTVSILSVLACLLYAAAVLFLKILKVPHFRIIKQGLFALTIWAIV